MTLDGHIMCSSIISSRQSTATSEIVKVLLVITVYAMVQQVPGTLPFTFTVTVTFTTAAATTTTTPTSTTTSTTTTTTATTNTRVAPNLTVSNSAEAEFGRISELKFSRNRSRIWLKLVFWSQNNTPVIKLMASTMLSAAIEAVHFSASCVALLFASYW